MTPGQPTSPCPPPALYFGTAASNRIFDCFLPPHPSTAQQPVCSQPASSRAGYLFEQTFFSVQRLLMSCAASWPPTSWGSLLAIPISVTICHSHHRLAPTVPAPAVMHPGTTSGRHDLPLYFFYHNVIRGGKLYLEGKIEKLHVTLFFFFFSRRQVLVLEGVVHDTVEKLCVFLENSLDRKREFNLRATLHAVSVDTITEYAFADCWDQLGRPDLGEWYQRMTHERAKAFATESLPTSVFNNITIEEDSSHPCQS